MNEDVLTRVVTRRGFLTAAGAGLLGVPGAVRELLVYVGTFMSRPAENYCTARTAVMKLTTSL